MRARTVAAVFAVVVLAVALAFAWSKRRHESTPAMRGERLAREQGCFACHGPSGRGGVPDPAAPAGCMPGWDPVTAATYASSVEDIVDWIRTGPRR